MGTKIHCRQLLSFASSHIFPAYSPRNPPIQAATIIGVYGEITTNLPAPYGQSKIVTYCINCKKRSENTIGSKTPNKTIEINVSRPMYLLPRVPIKIATIIPESDNNTASITSERTTYETSNDYNFSNKTFRIMFHTPLVSIFCKSLLKKKTNENQQESK